MQRIACIVGARPNFMKIAPVLRAMRNSDAMVPTLIHTGQHYDANLSDIFFQELEIKLPDISLDIGSGTHGKQTGQIITAVEQVLIDAAESGRPFDRMLVVGDVNSTMAAAIAAAKLQVPVAHVEAGLRSFDRSMPEEINRLVTDSICDLLLVSEPAGIDHLRREGHAEEQIHLVGNVMIDTLFQQLERARAADTLARLGLEPGSYGVVTLHRPANVDHQHVLGALIDVIAKASHQMPMMFPMHPRTRERVDRFGLQPQLVKSGIKVLDPLGYIDFLSLTSSGRRDHYRFWWLARRIDRVGSALPDDATQHGASDHRRTGHQRSGRQRCRLAGSIPS